LGANPGPRRPQGPPQIFPGSGFGAKLKSAGEKRRPNRASRHALKESTIGSSAAWIETPSFTWLPEK